MRSSFLCGVTLALGLTAVVGSAQQISNPQETVWFALNEEFGSNGKLVLDELGKISNGKLEKIAENCDYEGPAYKQFFAEYLNAGHGYSVLFGGASAGSVVVRERGKDSATTAVDYKGPARIHGKVMGLATNAATENKMISSRRVPVAAESQAASALARELFAKAGLQPALLDKIKGGNLTRTVLLPSTSPSLIGSFSIKQDGVSRPTHNLFFIATFNGTEYVPEFVWTKISKNELESESKTLVDQGDIFGDGQEEVIVLDLGWENCVYEIFRRTKDSSRWELIFTSNVFGCA